ncbi:MAG: prephenate dehydratase domain-containing protein [Verrucomicrobiia bacterium]
MSAKRAVKDKVTTANGLVPTIVAYFGKPGSYSHDVAARRFQRHALLKSCRMISDVFETVARDAADYGVVPIENTLGGPIYDTVDELIRQNEPPVGLTVCEELSLHVMLSLLGRKQSPPKRIYSHFVPLKHCGDWVRARYPGAAILETESTSEAVERAAKEKDAWAIGNRGAAAMHKLHVIVPKLGTKAENITRFYLLGRHSGETRSATRTLLVFGLQHRPGSLVLALQVLQKHKINMTRIVSRALPHNPEEYLFLVQCEGTMAQPHFKKAFAELTDKSRHLRSLGSFRVVEKFE